MTRGVVRRPLIGLLIPAALAVLFILVPLIGLLSNVSWATLPAALTSSDVLTALRLSLECSLLALGIALIIGVRLASVLPRTALPARRLIRALVLLPLVLPPVVGVIALQTAFGRASPIGSFLYHVFGVTLPVSTAGDALTDAFD